MTEADAKQVLKILQGADGDCSECADRLLISFKERFPHLQHLEFVEPF